MIRAHTVRLLLGWGAILALLALFVIPLPTDSADRLWNTLHQWCHYVIFAIITMIVFWCTKHRTTGTNVFLLVALVLSPMLIEIFQPAFGRTRSWLDALFGIAGVFATLCVVSNLLRNRFALRIGLVLLITSLTLIPVSAVVIDRMNMIRAFPVLATFDSRHEMGRWESLGLDVERIQPKSISIQTKASSSERYPGLFMIDFIHDWSKALSLIISYEWTGTEPLPGWIRLDDRHAPDYADRFQQQLSWQPGTHRLSLPLGDIKSESGRRLQLNHIHTWGLFFDGTNVNTPLILHKIEIQTVR